MTEKEIKLNQLRQYQALPLSGKIRLTEMRIREAWEHYEGHMYIALSGKDSCCGADQVWKLFPNCPAVFVDTGIELASVRRNIYRMIEQGRPIEIIKPERNFWEVQEQEGWPILSKQICMGINRFVNTKSFTQKKLRAFGGINPTSGKRQQRTIPLKYHYILKEVLAGRLKTTTKCCGELKIKPFVKYEKRTGRKPFVFTMASDSETRKESYLKNGCNAFNSGGESRPIMFWKEQDVLEYIVLYDVMIPSAYGEVERQDDGKLKCSKDDRTGCGVCMFGIMFEKDRKVNRIQRLAETDPEMYAEFVKRGGGEVMDLLKIEWRV